MEEVVKLAVNCFPMVVAGRSLNIPGAHCKAGEMNTIVIFMLKASAMFRLCSGAAMYLSTPHPQSSVGFTQLLMNSFDIAWSIILI